MNQKNVTQFMEQSKLFPAFLQKKIPVSILEKQTLLSPKVNGHPLFLSPITMTMTMSTFLHKGNKSGVLNDGTFLS